MTAATTRSTLNRAGTGPTQNPMAPKRTSLRATRLHRLTRGALALVLWLGSMALPCAGQAPAGGPAEAGSQGEAAPDGRTKFDFFAADLPPDWRTATPDEVFAMRESLPFVMRVPHPGSLFSVGNVDAWQKDGFDGQALIVIVRENEIPITEEAIDVIRANWSDPEIQGGARKVVEAEITTIGQDAHPAIRCIIDTAPWGGLPASRALEFYVPTAGHMLILSFRSWHDDFAAMRDAFESVVASATFPRPPRGVEEEDTLTDRLLNAAIIGALVGVALIGIRLSRSRAPRPTPS